MIWTNEEGSLYPPAMMSSGVICNEYLPEEIGKKFCHEDMLVFTSVLDKTKTDISKLLVSDTKNSNLSKFR